MNPGCYAIRIRLVGQEERAAGVWWSRGVERATAVHTHICIIAQARVVEVAVMALGAEERRVNRSRDVVVTCGLVSVVRIATRIVVANRKAAGCAKCVPFGAEG